MLPGLRSAIWFKVLGEVVPFCGGKPMIRMEFEACPGALKTRMRLPGVPEVGSASET